MGLFSSTPDRETQVRTGAVFPSRAERQKCWAARDVYFACLDANSILDPSADPAATKKACGSETEEFEKDCAAKWVSYFKEWRVIDAKKRAKIEQLEKEGAIRMEATPEFGKK